MSELYFTGICSNCDGILTNLSDKSCTMRHYLKIGTKEVR